MENCLFYTTSLIMLLFACISQVAKNNINRVFSLIITFFLAAILCITLNAEFIASMIVIVYMGAIAMLFVFVIMIIGDEKNNKKSTKRNILLSTLISGLFCLICVYQFIAHGRGDNMNISSLNTKQIGNFLYQMNWQTLFFIGIGLFVGMIGVIMITKDLQKLPNRAKLQIKKINLNNPDIRKGVKII